jgi:hypothetical protein
LLRADGRLVLGANPRRGLFSRQASIGDAIGTGLSPTTPLGQRLRGRFPRHLRPTRQHSSPLS